MKNKEIKDKKEQEVAEMLERFENLGAYEKGVVIGYTKGLSESVNIITSNKKIS